MNWLQHPLIHDLGLTLLHFLWQGLVIGALYAGARFWFRNAPASLRYALAVLTLGVLALTPPATLAWLALQAPVPAADAGTIAAAGSFSLETVLAHSAPLAGIAPWVVGIWLAGVVVLSLRLVAGWHYLATLRRSADRAAARHLRPRLEALAAHMGIRRRVTVACSERVESPILLGWLRPVILLPASVIAGFPTRQLEMVLVHELAHVRRHDHLVNLFQTVVETLLFYHPVVAWVSRDVRLERENACDDLAVDTARDRVGYVEMLAALENLRHADFRLALAVNDGQVLTRIRRLLTPQGRRGFGMLGPLLAIVTTVAGITGISWLPLDGDESGPMDAAEIIEPVATQSLPPPQVEPLDRQAPSAATVAEPATDEPDAQTAPATARTRTEAAESEAQPSPSESLAATDATPEADGEAGSQRRPEEPAGDPGPHPVPATGDPATADQSPARLEPDVATNSPSPAPDAGLPDAESLMTESGLALAALNAAPGPLPMAPESAGGGGGDELPITGGNIIERVAPSYPQRAQRRQASGTVEVEFTVGRDGSVGDIRVLNERPRHLSFGRAARDAIAQWQFEPFQRGDRRIERRIQMEVEFDPGEDACGPRTGTRINHC